ncbi:hypothetical protein EV190_11576 [Actinorugispora endophytica]|uniref:Uncharacterized protein n=1 Tax=Actinorugispora endophytica TaxID=1605990 RepID=A0A4R6UTP5_9ACTN|nr:hypothetical protein EV190_11576 [Actinorugispora endophytica]
MARRDQGGVNPSDRSPGALVLDSHGLSRLIEGDPLVTRLHQDSRARASGTVISSVTLVEAQHPKVRQSAVNYVLSGLHVIAPRSQDRQTGPAAAL